MNNILNSNCDGVIFIGSLPPELYELLINRIPESISIFDVPEHHRIDCISVDYEGSTYQLVKRLIEFGHRDIAFIGGTGYSYSPEDVADGVFHHREARLQGYLKALIDWGIPINRRIVKDGNWDIESAYHKMAGMLDSKENLTAVVCANDRMAIGAMRAINERGLRIPDDISVTGFDDIEIAKYLNPPLTTVYFPKEQIGKLAVRTLLDNVNSTEDKNDRPLKTILVASSIMERDSVKPLNG